jgi:conjugative relaxase-like TrwC/TraI family protein
MGFVVTVKSGYDLGYVWKNQAQAQPEGSAEKVPGGYYINAAQGGEAPGRWFGRGAEALGFAAGQQVEREPYEAVYRQVDPRDGTKLGRSPGGYARFADHLAALAAAEPHATSERLLELERLAAQATRKSPAYTDMTVSVSKSVSIVDASIRENARQARIAGDEAAAAWWDARQAEMAGILQAANRAGLEHLERWAVTRTGHHGARIDGQEPGRYEAAGLVVTSWLQGTSRDGDPQLHIHNQVARMVRTERDGAWRALDTMSVRAQLGAVQAIVTTHAESEMTRRLGVEWTARPDGIGNEVKGITREQIETYSTRTQAIDADTDAARAAYERKYGRPPTRRELLYIRQEVTMATRDGKPEGAIDWDAQVEGWAAKWDASDGTTLAQVAPRVTDLGGPGGAAAPRDPAPREPSPDAQARAMKTALARVQQKHSTWSRADLMRELSACMPPEAHAMEPVAAVALLHDLTARALAGETEQVACLDAPEWPPLPDYLRRDLDGRSIYTRPGTERYATHLQLSREEQLLAAAQRQSAPSLTREESAQILGADADTLEGAGHARAQEGTAQLQSGLSLSQAAALHHALTSARTVSVIVGPAGSGKTHVLAQAAHMWRGDVIGLAPSQAARNVLAFAAGIPAYNTAQWLGNTPDARGVRGMAPLRPGTLILLDEGSMTSLEDMAAIVARADELGCKVLLTGDPGQLEAVEGGGGMALLAREQEHAQLAEPVRFTAGWEREASLRLRSGDTAVLTEYDQHGRIRGGDAEQVLDGARQVYVAGYLAGRDVFLMAQSHDICRDLSQRIREDLQHLGHVGRGPEVTLREGARASAGDLILIKENDHRIGLANGDVLRIDAIDGQAVTGRLALGPDPDTGEMRFGERVFSYSDCERSADLAYCSTGHAGQGRTVSEGIAVITGSEDRRWTYVALSRGADSNRAFVMTAVDACAHCGEAIDQLEPGQWTANGTRDGTRCDAAPGHRHSRELGHREADPRPGTRAAPELERYERTERERQGLTAGVTPSVAEAQSRAALGVLSDVLERSDAELSALEVQRRNLAGADHLGKLHAIWEGETRDAITSRYEQSLRDHLPEEYRVAQLPGTATWLWRSLRAAEAAGMDADAVLAGAIGSKPLTGSRDVVAVIDSRVREETGTLVPLPARPWSEQVPDIGEPQRREYVTALAEAMDQRKERLGEFTAAAAPPWAVRGLGPVPDEPLDRLEWQQRASHVAAYRELFGFSDPAEPIGPEPSGDTPEKRGAWHAAFRALGPVDGVDVRGEPDGRLLHMRSTYETETAWAPRHVGTELRQVRMGADEASVMATRAAAEAQAARERGDEQRADQHETLARSARAMEAAYRGYEARFADTMEARAEWERSTEQPRHLAVAADSEYRTRHPDTDLPALRSAEPPRPVEDERQALVPEDTGERETPAWVTEMAERTRAAGEKLDERKAVRVPNEDHEWQDEGEAWPDMLRLERDAIIQPPKPEIRPAADLAQRVPDREAEHEAGL